MTDMLYNEHPTGILSFPENTSKIFQKGTTTLTFPQSSRNDISILVYEADIRSYSRLMSPTVKVNLNLTLENVIGHLDLVIFGSIPLNSDMIEHA